MLSHLPCPGTTFLDPRQGSDQGTRLDQTLPEHCSLHTLKGSCSKGGGGGGSPMAQVRIPVSPLTRSGTMGRNLNLSAPQFLHL